jgi:hypothetical protein
MDLKKIQWGMVIGNTLVKFNRSLNNHSYKKNVFMKSNHLVTVLTFFLFLTLFSGCTLIGDIFEAGIWVGVIIVIVVVAIIIWIFSKLLG